MSSKEYLEESTDEELKKLKKYSSSILIIIILSLLFAWTVIGLVIGVGCLIYVLIKKHKIELDIKRRYFEKICHH